MSDWPPWSLQGEPLALARYVLPDHVARYVQLPGPSREGRTRRLRTVYAALAGLRISYAHDAPGAEAGRQIIRTPEEVLWAPRHATCLDLAVVLAGGCLKAGLHSVVVILDPPDGDGAGHALVLVRLDHDRLKRTDGVPSHDVWDRPPAGLLDSLQRKLDGPDKDVLAVDPVGLAVSLGTAPTRGVGVDLAAAAASGARYLAGGDGRPAWRWRLGVDVGSAWSQEHTHRPDDRPEVEPLREPYLRPDTAQSPLRLLRAEYRLVPFQNRDELTVLRDWCRQVAAGDRTGLGVITGIGGSGKTRLALELAERLRREGWYAGTLPKGTAGAGWLGEVVSPMLVVLDYADGRAADAAVLLKALRVRRGPPAVVLCTARSTEGDWLADIVASLDDDRHPFRREDVGLPDTRPDALDVYWRTVAALTSAADAVAVPDPPHNIRWTTLDLVLLGWIAAQGTPTLPKTRGELYDEALRHEESYWCTVYRDRVAERQPSRTRLRTAAACLSLVAPTEPQAGSVLEAVTDLAEDARERHDVRDTLVACFRSEAGEGLALRPDPVGDHLLLRELTKDAGLLERTLDAAGEAKLEQALVILVRAGQNDADASMRLITGLLEHDSGRWSAVLSVAAAQGGTALASLERLAARPDTRLPLDELSNAVPFSSLGLYDLGLIVDRRRLDDARTAGAEPETLADLLVRVSERARNTGDRNAALTTVTEAVTHYRALAQANPAAYLPDLATSLNNLSNQQADTEAGASAWRAAIDDMTSLTARAELRAAWAGRLASAGLAEQARQELQQAAVEADDAPADESIVVTARARQAVRSAAQTQTATQPDGLPEWATAPIPAAHVELVNAAAQAADWPGLQAVLDRSGDMVGSPQLRV
ncbi:MAG: hypothetical protein ACRDZ4_15930 [Egibacteraceae bacterium]